MEIIKKINVWYDTLDKRWKTAAFVASLVTAFVSGAIGLAWLAVIFFVGITVARVWYLLQP